jgi:hypothetical protein
LPTTCKTFKKKVVAKNNISCSEGTTQTGAKRGRKKKNEDEMGIQQSANKP